MFVIFNVCSNTSLSPTSGNIGKNISYQIQKHLMKHSLCLPTLVRQHGHTKTLLRQIIWQISLHNNVPSLCWALRDIYIKTPRKTSDWIFNVLLNNYARYVWHFLNCAFHPSLKYILWIPILDLDQLFHLFNHLFQPSFPTIVPLIGSWPRAYAQNEIACILQ